MPQKAIHFQVSERKLLLRGVDVFMVVFGLYWLGLFFDTAYLEISWDNRVAILILLFYLSVFGTVFEMYDLQKSSQLDVTFKTLVFTVSTTVLFYFLTPILTPFLPEKRLQIVYFYLTIVVAIFVWRVAYVNLMASPRFYKKVVLVGEVAFLEAFVNALISSDPNYKIVGFIRCNTLELGSDQSLGIKEYPSDALLQVVKDEHISEIVVASYSSDMISAEIYADLMLLLERGFTIREYTQVYEEITHRVPVQFVGKDFYTYFPFSRSNQNTLYLFFNRVFDVLFSLFGLLCGLVILPFILIGNFFGNSGPLVYRQDRVGKNGRVFKIIKLRSMIINAETAGARWAQVDDVRVTPFGRFLRRSRIDEIPQFINIIKGEMSVIGPRPERPFFIEELASTVPFYQTRHIVKPGLTGWAQVKTRYGASVEESIVKLQYDLYYIKHRGFFLDLNIMVKTLSTVLYYRGQ
ncbi:exopolysaccharide biosynthesis polyprenyl glycosylphosphotransferase [Gelidibacter salicanalis]|uniref:Exopolysaccharide biosynthesis polyprenyl glycosylphosphotransferase n=1 Tax=Gelidibacter salicanalis TaxID=291193 RepID=A0A934NCC1_9FLAO|nr:exopolysaccharide biosynthesis polyprenyl glycosylphosphotransferase [Gelidibacter salicanalis]MBJ7880560.1 exopolysaccharide biosynthesis polyprenyl glycosylphosphotransferase [Gelidibacter salicanalis]